MDTEGEPVPNSGEGSLWRKVRSSSVSVYRKFLKAIFAKEKNESYISKEAVAYKESRIISTLSNNNDHKTLLAVLPQSELGTAKWVEPRNVNMKVLEDFTKELRDRQPKVYKTEVV
ncbi:hypothetical protein Tco_0198563, partial [Tanacetum coccineum]